jgi:hypothetical protein
MTRDEIRAAMNSTFLALPEWLQTPFVPFQENVSLLLDGGNDDLARRVVAAIYPPPNWLVDQISAFDVAKTDILSGIETMIADTDAANPLNSPEALAMLALAAQRRAES